MTCDHCDRQAPEAGWTLASAGVALLLSLLIVVLLTMALQAADIPAAGANPRPCSIHVRARGCARGFQLDV